MQDFFFLAFLSNWLTSKSPLKRKKNKIVFLPIILLEKALKQQQKRRKQSSLSPRTKIARIDRLGKHFFFYLMIVHRRQFLTRSSLFLLYMTRTYSKKNLQLWRYVTTLYLHSVLYHGYSTILVHFMGARKNLTATESILTLERNWSLSWYMVYGKHRGDGNAFPVKVHSYSFTC